MHNAFHVTVMSTDPSALTAPRFKANASAKRGLGEGHAANASQASMAMTASHANVMKTAFGEVPLVTLPLANANATMASRGSIVMAAWMTTSGTDATGATATKMALCQARYAIQRVGNASARLGSRTGGAGAVTLVTRVTLASNTWGLKAL